MPLTIHELELATESLRLKNELRERWPTMGVAEAGADRAAEAQALETVEREQVVGAARAAWSLDSRGPTTGSTRLGGLPLGLAPGRAT